MVTQKSKIQYSAEASDINGDNKMAREKARQIYDHAAWDKSYGQADNEVLLEESPSAVRTLKKHAKEKEIQIK